VTQHNGNGRHKEKPWSLKREKILFSFGIALIVAEFINAEIRGSTFHLEFLIIGAAFCGISIAQWGDRK
jgi:hypothetical protein